MATPALRAAGTAVFAGNNISNPTSLSPARPTGTVAGDVLVLLTYCRSITATVATPTGWTLVSGFPKRHGTTSGGSWYAFVRVADLTATDSPTISWSGVTTGTSGDSSSAHQLAFSGTQAVLDGVASTTGTGANSNVPAVTTGAAKSLRIGAVAKVLDASGVTYTIAAPMTEALDGSTTSGTGHCFESSYEMCATAGSQGSALATCSNATSALWIGVTFALLAAITSLGSIPNTDTVKYSPTALGAESNTGTYGAGTLGGQTNTTDYP